MKKKYDKASLLTAGVVALLIVFFVGGFLIGLNTVLDMEGAFPPVENTEGISPAPETAEEALAFLNRTLDKAQKEMPKTDTWASFDIDGDSIKSDGFDQFVQALGYVKGSAEDFLTESVEKPCSDYFKSMAAVLRRPGITSDSITDFNCNYIFYQCSSCGVTSDEPLPNCEECGNELPYNLRYADRYAVTLNLKVDEKVLKAAFAPRTDGEILKLANTALDGKAKLDKIDVTYTDLTVYYEVDRLTDQIAVLRYEKGMDVAFDATHAFSGDYAKFKGGNVGFRMVEKYGFDFTWPALTLSDSYMTVEPKGSENLLATLTCDDATKYDVTWKSSDESIVTVDDEGYFDATRKTGKAIITASFEFGGKTYSDECEIEVKVPTERLSMNHKKVKLAVGETEELAVKFTPSDATIQTVKWYSENEDIATVDADGKVTAVAPGKVTVYCLSDDGYFKSTSEVTVQ